MALRPLKHLSRRPIQAKDFDKLLNTQNDMLDQAVALLYVALLERMLERCIMHRLVPLSKTQRNELFLGLGPIASFSAKIKVAYALGIIGNKCLSELEIIKNVRNQFAHSFHILRFQTPTIAAACRMLKTPERALVVFPMTCH